MSDATIPYSIIEPEPRVGFLDDDQAGPAIWAYPGPRTQISAELNRTESGRPFGYLRVGAVKVQFSDSPTISRLTAALAALGRHLAEEYLVEDGPDDRAPSQDEALAAEMYRTEERAAWS